MNARRRIYKITHTALLVLLALLLLFAVSGCASAPGRFLTPAQDAEIGLACADVPCVFVPAPVFERMIEALRGHSL